MLLLTLRGTPTRHYGDELGLPRLEVPPERQQDPLGRRVPAGAAMAAALLCPGKGAPTPASARRERSPGYPLGPGAAEHSVAGQLADPRSLLSLYRALPARRRASPVLRLGDYRSIAGAPGVCFAYRRSLPGEPTMTVALNFASSPLEVPELGPGRIVVSTGMDRAGEVVAGRLRLGPHEGVVLEERAL